eukprot:c24706_g1_i1 orf=181-963(-)
MGNILSLIGYLIRLPSSIWALLARFLSRTARRRGLKFDYRIPPPEPKPTEVDVERARKELGINGVEGLLCAVVGDSKAGKSAFINGIRQMVRSDEGTAQGWERNSAPAVLTYPEKYPSINGLVFWEFSGIEYDSMDRYAAKYFIENKLYAFDCILILSSYLRFLQKDIDIAKLAMEYGKPYALIHTEADSRITSIAERLGSSRLDASKILREFVEAAFNCGMEEAGVALPTSEKPLYIVSNSALRSQEASDTNLVGMDER